LGTGDGVGVGVGVAGRFPGREVSEVGCQGARVPGCLWYLSNWS